MRSSTTKPVKAILYARFSPRPNAATCESNHTQLEYCRRYCEANGYQVVAEHGDDAMSGGNLHRDGLWAAIADLRRDYVLVVQYLDRLARDVGESIYVEQEVEKRGGRIISVAGEGTWNDGPDDRLVRTIARAIAQYQREIQAERTAAAMRRHQLNGRRMSDRIPFGFRAGPDKLVGLNTGDDKIIRTLEPDSDEQAIIGKILHWNRQGKGLRAIGRALSREGIQCRGSAWHHTTIKSIIERAA